MSGVWWWLRGTGGERGSSESVSSVGSACTAASFAFVAPRWPPAPSGARRSAPRVAPRLPLHVKYGLPQDAATLPVRRPPPALARRANSECGPRRAPYVPGKRRAPSPPSLAPRRRATKRRAPRPPAFHRFTAPPDLMDVPPASVPPATVSPASDRDLKLRPERGFLRQIFENRWRNSSADHAPPRILPSISELDREATRIMQSVKSRGSSSDSNDVYAPRGRDSKENWICTRCLRKYGASTPICVYCLPNNEQPRGSGTTDLNNRNLEHSTQSQLTNIDLPNRVEVDEKEKLKEMLKEIKDSLPKRPKHNKEAGKASRNNVKERWLNHKSPTPQTSRASLETPTLPIGYSAIEAVKNMKESLQESTKTVTSSQTSAQCSRNGLLNPSNAPAAENKSAIGTAILITHQVIVMDPQARTEIEIKSKSSPKLLQPDDNNEKKLQKPETKLISKQTTSSQTNTANESKNQPLRISSLLNPVYIPKSSNNILAKTGKPASKTECTGIAATTANSQNRCTPIKATVASSGLSQNTINENKNITPSQPVPVNRFSLADQSNSRQQKTNIEINVAGSPSTSKETAIKVDEKPNSFNVQLLSQHSRKRELINQLEKSIAKGDERAAAEAASQLAQLKLSCSVLSFSSQIMTEASTSKAGALDLKVAEIQKNSPCEMQTNQINVSNSPLSINKSKDGKKSVLPKTSERKLNSEHVNKMAVKTGQGNGSALPGPSTSKEPAGKADDRMTMIQVWVEDKNETRGPIRLSMSRDATLRELKQQAEALLGLSSGLQRWIVGTTLCNEDNTPLRSLAGPQLAVPFYLCLVEKETIKRSDVYSELIALEERALIPNSEAFECGVCLQDCGAGDGVVLRECVHTFCRECLTAAAEWCEEGALACPGLGCMSIVQEREVRALLPREQYERWLARGLARAETSQRHAFHCRTPDCAGWALCGPGVATFPCPVCRVDNCVPCQAIHSGETCAQHRLRLESAALAGADCPDDGSRALLATMIARGEALACPECDTVITKKWGCDWIKCVACKTEICWVTRGRRWGPAGRGDTSAGCRCGVDGQRCHPACGYCH